MATAYAPPATVPLDDQIAELERTIASREYYYPEMVRAGEMSREVGDRCIQRMRATLATLRRVQATTLSE